MMVVFGRVSEHPEVLPRSDCVTPFQQRRFERTDWRLASFETSMDRKQKSEKGEGHFDMLSSSEVRVIRSLYSGNGWKWRPQVSMFDAFSCAFVLT